MNDMPLSPLNPALTINLSYITAGSFSEPLFWFWGWQDCCFEHNVQMWKEENMLEKLDKDRKIGKEKHLPNTQGFRTGVSSIFGG